jgi:hypothetical protein
MTKTYRTIVCGTGGVGVLHCARDLGDWSADDVFVRFLVRGEADAARPLGYGAHHWLVTIEGRPSLRMLLEVNASMESGAASPQTVVA